MDLLREGAPASRRRRVAWRVLVCALFPLFVAPARADVPVESTGRIEQLPARPGPHWVWVYDMVYDHMPDGRASLLDGATGKFLGMLGTGYSFTQLTLPRHLREIYSAETHYARTTRGARTDVVSIYDPRTLEPVGEIGIPPKRGSTIPTLHNAVLTDDDRFMLVFNLNPGSSVTVVEPAARRFVEEIETPGCALLYPAGNRRFFMLCQDGSALVVDLDETGHASARRRTAPLFDPQVDPLSEKAARHGSTWLFASFDGWVHGIDASGPEPVMAPRWSLLSDAERKATWRMGGTQHLAVHEASGRLYSIMHKGGPWSRKDPGMEVWVYDLATRERVQVIPMRDPTGLIAVSQDDAPVLFAADVAVDTINVYDARSGAFLRRIEQVGYTPTGLQAPWRP